MLSVKDIFDLANLEDSVVKSGIDTYNINATNKEQLIINTFIASANSNQQKTRAVACLTLS